MRASSFLIRLRLIFSSITVVVLLAAAVIAQDHSLEADTLVEREIKRGETHSYQVVLKAGQYVRLLAKQKDVDIQLILYGPKDEELVRVDAATYNIDNIFNFTAEPVLASASETEALSFQSHITGTYRLDVRMVKSAAAPGSYVLKLDTRRDITDQDRKHVVAQSAFLEGEKVRKQRTPAALRKAIEKYQESLKLWQRPSDLIEQSHTLDKLALANFHLDEKQKAIELFQQTLRLWREASGQREQAYTLENIGDLYYLQRDVKTFEFFNPALEIWQHEADLRQQVLAHFKLSYSHTRLGEQQTASFHFDEALKLSRASSDKPLQAFLLINLCGTDQSDNKRDALKYLEDGLELCRTADHATCEAAVLIAMAVNHESIGNHSKALHYYDQVLRFTQELTDDAHLIFALIHTGELFFYQSDYQTAIDYYTKALTTSRANGNHWGEAYSLFSLGRVHELLGDYEKGIQYHEQSLPHWRVIRDYDGVAYSLNQIAVIHSLRGQTDQALLMLDEALQLMRYSQDRYGEARTLDNIGLVYASRQEHQKALDFFTKALPLRRPENDASGEARTLANIGSTYDAMGEKQKAFDHFRQALTRYKSIANRSGEADIHYRLALLKRSQGNDTDARFDIETALAIAESVRSGVYRRNLRESYFSSIQTYYEFYIDLLMSLHKQQPSRQLDRLALNIVERARARGMLELLTESRAEIRQGVDHQLLEQERLVQQQLNEKEQRRMKLLSGNAPSKEVEVLENEIRSLVSQFEELEAEIKAKSPRYAALTQPQPLSVEQIQQRVLDSETLLLEYALGEKRSFVWAITKTSVSSYELPGRSDIDAATRTLYDVITARQTKRRESQTQYLSRVQKADAQYQRQSEALSQILLGPVASLLGAQRLLIVPDGSLAYVPFATLPNPGTANPYKQLVADHQIAYLPSASTLAVLRDEIKARPGAPGALAVFADPVFHEDDDRVRRRSNPRVDASRPVEMRGLAEQALRDSGLLTEGVPLARLPFSRQEAEDIAALTSRSETLKALGFNANLATAMSADLSRYRIVHFATHALINSNRPYLSGLLLSLVDERGRYQDGFLSLSQIYNLDLPVDLVVLSACQTAMGKEVKGEGIIGLTRAFMYAGAPRVMASLWKVDDAATAEMVKLFYRGLLKSKLPPAAALRAAQFEMSKHKLWNSPYYWAGFILQGEPN